MVNIDDLGRREALPVDTMRVFSDSELPNMALGPLREFYDLTTRNQGEFPGRLITTGDIIIDAFARSSADPKTAAWFAQEVGRVFPDVIKQGRENAAEVDYYGLVARALENPENVNTIQASLLELGLPLLPGSLDLDSAGLSAMNPAIDYGGAANAGLGISHFVARSEVHCNQATSMLAYSLRLPESHGLDLNPALRPSDKPVMKLRLQDPHGDNLIVFNLKPQAQEEFNLTPIATDEPTIYQLADQGRKGLSPELFAHLAQQAAVSGGLIVVNGRPGEYHEYYNDIVPHPDMRYKPVSALLQFNCSEALAICGLTGTAEQNLKALDMRRLTKLTAAQSKNLTALGTQLRKLYPSFDHITVTLGPSGVLSIDDEGSRFVPTATPEHIRRKLITNGAGDSFLAACATLMFYNNNYWERKYSNAEIIAAAQYTTIYSLQATDKTTVNLTPAAVREAYSNLTMM